MMRQTAGSAIPPRAALAAIDGNYAIECDVQISADGEAMVFHDDNLDRLTEGRGQVASFPTTELKTHPLQEHHRHHDDAR